jgi:hypothetical protein
LFAPEATGPESEASLNPAEQKVSGLPCKRVEFLFSERQQIAVLNSGPAALRDGSDFVAVKFARKAAVDAFVE